MTEDQIKFEYNHGNLLFPADMVFNHTSMSGTYKENFVYCHWHHQMELVYVTEGNVLFEVDTKCYTLAPGEALLLNANELHTGYALNQATCSLYAFVFDPEMLSFAKSDICQTEYIDPFITGRYKMPTLISSKSKWEKEILHKIVHIIKQVKQPHPGYELQVKASLYSIFAILITNQTYIDYHNEVKHDTYRVDRIKKVLNYIKENYKERIYIDELSTLINMSTDHFYKVFKAVTGKTPIEYINHCRIEEAEALLSNSDLSILNIALTTGFENVSYFIKVFKQFHHCTPNEFRKKLSQAIE